MSIAINTNAASIAAQRNLLTAANRLSTTFERLGSGKRINRADDDAAGMSISTRMNSQVRGFNQALRNVNDGISLSQVATGALGDVQGILQRMRELAVQAANDTNTTSDRQDLQAEFDQLRNQIAQIAANTDFNGTKLLDGTFSGKTFHVSSNDGQTVTIDSVMGVNPSVLGKTKSNSFVEIVPGGIVTIPASYTNWHSGEPNELTINSNQDGTQIYSDGTWNDLPVNIATGQGIIEKSDSAGTPAGWTHFGNSVYKLTTGNISWDQAEAEAASQGGHLVAINSAAENEFIRSTFATGPYPAYYIGYTDAMSEGDFIWTNGDPVNSAYQTTVPDTQIVIPGTTSDITLSDVSLTTQGKAETAISVVDQSINDVAGMASSFGALQNRMDSISQDLMVMSQNTSGAKSRIEDADYAAETANMAKNSIIQQAANAILAQANQQPTSVLKLLNF